MVKFLLFCILLVLCWPLALVALVLYPLVWLLLLPFRIVGNRGGRGAGVGMGAGDPPRPPVARPGLNCAASGNQLDQQDRNG